MTFGSDTFYFLTKTLLVVLGTLGMMLSCTNIKYSYKKCLGVLVLYLAWVSAVSFTVLKLFDFLMLLRLCPFFISIPAMLALYFISENSPWQAVFHYTMQVSISTVLAITQTIIVTLLHGGRIMDFCIRFSMYALCIAVEWIFVRKNFLKLNYLPDKNWRILSFVPTGFIALIFLIGLYPVHYLDAPQNIIYLYAITAIMLLVYMIIFHTLTSQHDLQSSEHTNSILVSQLNSVKKHLDTINETEEHLKIYRHDMRFYLAGISEMLKNGNADEALKLIGGADTRLDESRYKVYCDDKMINAVLSYYIDKAEANGIKTEISFLPPDELAIDIVDFTVMLSNALENAVNACMKIENPGERRLRIKTKNVNQYIIEIANSFDGIVEFDDNGLPKSPNAGHGIGTRSIAAFAEKNGALLDYSVDGEWFRLRIAAM